MYLLSQQDPIKKGYPAIKIPDTIHFKSGLPINWIFTGKEGYIKKKAKENLNIEQIKKSFLKNQTTCGIIA